MFSFIHSIIGNNRFSSHFFAIGRLWPKKIYIYFFRSSIYQQFCIHANTVFIPLNPKFHSSLQPQDQLDVHHPFSPASKAQEAPKLAAEGNNEANKAQGLLLPLLLLSFVDGVSLLLRLLLVLLSSTTGVWSFLRAFSAAEQLGVVFASSTKLQEWRAME